MPDQQLKLTLRLDAPGVWYAADLRLSREELRPLTDAQVIDRYLKPMLAAVRQYVEPKL